MIELKARAAAVAADVQVLSIIHRVSDLRGAAGFAVRTLGLPATVSGPGYVVLDNRTVCIRLIADAAADSFPPLDLELAVLDVEEATAALIYVPGVRVEAMPRWVTETRREAVLEAPHRFRLILSRELTEDELAVTPSLPTAMPWLAEADVLVQALLKRVPIPFRSNARRRVVSWIETLASREGREQVDRELALHGLIQVTPKLDLPDLRRALEDRGIDVDVYTDDFLRE